MVRTRINKQYGLPAWVIDQVMAQLPYSPKPAGAVRNGHENAQGAKYWIYWVRDVSAAFIKFVSECEYTKAQRAKHLLIDGEFKLAPSARDRPATPAQGRLDIK